MLVKGAIYVHVFMCTALLISIMLGIDLISYDMCNNFKLLVSNVLARF
jgi:hypothetical protein